MDGNSCFDFEIPLFAVRRGLISGIGSAIRNLIAGLAQVGKNINLPYTLRERLNQEFLPWLDEGRDCIAFQKYPHVRGGTSVRFIEEAIYSQSSHRSKNILYCNYFLPPRLLDRGENITVIIHDSQPFVFPAYFSARKIAWIKWSYRRTLERADQVLVISEFERTQIARNFGDRLASRCRVVYNAIDWERYEKGEVSLRALELTALPYLLCVAQQAPHKNILKTIQAFLKLPSRYQDFRLVLVGNPDSRVRSYIQNELPEPLQRRVVLTGYVPDADLGHLYRNTSLFVLASSYEGFGMPAVEAMGLGAPTLVTHGTALPEVTLGQANYCVDLPSADAWAEAMANSLENRGDVADYTRLAAEIRKRFSPFVIAGDFLRAMESGNRLAARTGSEHS